MIQQRVEPLLLTTALSQGWATGGTRATSGDFQMARK